MSDIAYVVGVENVLAVLAATIDEQAASLTVESGGGSFPDSAFQVKIDNEIILVGSRSGTSFTGLSRAQEGTSAHQHKAGAAVVYVVGGDAIVAAASTGNGGSISYPGFDGAFYGNPSILDADGSQHTLSMAGIDSPPDWLDADGHVIAPGLYNFSVAVALQTAPTSSGLVVGCNDDFLLAEAPFAVDLLGTVTRQRFLETTDVFSLADNNVPIEASGIVFMPTDDTLQIYALVSIARLLT